MEARKLGVVTVAVKDLAQALRTFQSNFGLAVSRRGQDEQSGAESAYLRIGGAEIELVAASRAGGPVGDFIDKRGEGLFFLKLEVDDLERAVQELGAHGVAVRRDTSAAGHRVAWVGPAGTNGVVLELSEPRPSR